LKWNILSRCPHSFPYLSKSFDFKTECIQMVIFDNPYFRVTTTSTVINSYVVCLGSSWYECNTSTFTSPCLTYNHVHTSNNCLFLSFGLIWDILFILMVRRYVKNQVLYLRLCTRFKFKSYAVFLICFKMI
jgi:hypothetical protein